MILISSLGAEADSTFITLKFMIIIVVEETAK